MKNSIPLVVAVVLGLAAVFAVSRTVSKKEDQRDKQVSVLVAASELKKDSTLVDNMFREQAIPESAYAAHQHVQKSEREMIRGLLLSRDIPKGSFLLWRDVISDVSREVGKSEWALPVTFSSNAGIETIEPGDEVAIIMVRDIERLERTGQDADSVEKVVSSLTSVLFPCVRVMKKVKGAIIVSMKPQDAMVLLTAQLNANLYPMLRRRGDDNSSYAEDFAKIDAKKFEEFLARKPAPDARK